MTHTSSFAIQTPNDFFVQLIEPQYREFVQNNSSSRYALQTIFSVYHMYEWVHEEAFTKQGFGLSYPQDFQVGDYFEAARKICNGTKHFKLRAHTTVQSGFSSEFSDEFARPLNLA